jgi:hypothetical protein
MSGAENAFDTQRKLTLILRLVEAPEELAAVNSEDLVESSLRAKMSSVCVQLLLYAMREMNHSSRHSTGRVNGPDCHEFPCPTCGFSLFVCTWRSVCGYDCVGEGN